MLLFEHIEAAHQCQFEDGTSRDPSNGGESAVAAGTLIVVPLKDMKEFGNEFHAKLDLDLAEADKNQDLFRKGAQ